MNQRFFLPNPDNYHSHFDEDWEVNQWTVEGGAVITKTRYLSDADHPSCLKVVSDTEGKGVYYDITGVYGGCKYLIEFSMKCDSSGGFDQSIDLLVYDVTNSSNLVSEVDLGWTSYWTNYYKEFTPPASCTTIRVYLRRGSPSTNAAFYIDDIYVWGNALARDPDSLSPVYPREGTDHHMPSGNVVSDQTRARFEAMMRFNLLTGAQFTRILELHKSNHHTYFDDQNVPASIVRQKIYSANTYNFSGITNPSSTHVAYVSKSSSEPAAKGDFETEEFTTAEYQNIDEDDANYVEDTASTTGHYVYHKFKFKVGTQYYAADQVRNISITYKGSANDQSESNQDGVVLFAWNANGLCWVKLDESRTADKETLSFSTTRPEVAQLFVDTVDGYVRLLVQTQNTKGAGTALSLQSYFVQVVINKDLNIIRLNNKAKLDANGDIVWVKNLTDGTTLTLITHYWVKDDRESISVSISGNQNPGDMIEVKYNQYWLVKSVSLHETRIATSDALAASPPRSVELSLRGLVALE